jgi:DNA-binding transcriptional ArsR family regulator
MPSATTQRDAITNRMKAMQHPLRRRILLALQEHGEQSPSEIAKRLAERIGTVSQHLQMLDKYGCAEMVGEVKAGPSVKHIYRHTERHLIDVGEWELLDPEVKEGFLVDCMQPAVDDVTISLRSGTLGSDERFHLTRSPVHGMDQQGVEEALAIHLRAYREILELPAKCAARMKETGEDAVSMSSFQGCFEVPHF